MSFVYYQGDSIEKILVTAALPYVNNVPHIGNIVGCHLPADIFARFCRLAGYETVFIGGSDEHGTPIEVAARKVNKSPRELCDEYYKIHKEIYDWLDISYDNFSRTSYEIHHKTTQEFFLTLYEKGFISEGLLNLPYCENDERVLPDRYVEGKCPVCGYEKARGDQCERCSTILDPKDLIEPYCVICGSKPIFKNVKHLFFDLNKLQDKLREWIISREGIISQQVINYTLSLLESGLKPRCITRDISWGVKVPIKGYEDKVFYVWFDAPIGYISSTKEWSEKIGNRDAWKDFWIKKDAKIFHFIGKDNIPFHTIFWPAMLIAEGRYNLPYNVVGLQYLNYEGDKISKSSGWGIFCENLPKSGIDSDVWRYYLTFLIPETSDTEWKWSEFKERINNDLIANFGNFVYRSLSFIKNNFDGRVPKAYYLDEMDRRMLILGEKYAIEIKDLMLKVKIRDSLRKVLEFSSECNKYFNDSEPWKKIKENKEIAGSKLYVAANLCYDLAILISPFLPKTAKRISEQLNTPLGNLNDCGKARVRENNFLGDVKILFQKLDDEMIEKVKKIVTTVSSY